MKFQAEIGSSTLLKKGMKIVLHVPDDEVDKVMGGLNNFIKKPITIEMLVDGKKVMEDFDKITPDQRNKVFAVVKDIADATGDESESVRQSTKIGFMQTFGLEDFSLKNCTKEIASQYIEYLLRLAFELDVPFSEDVRKGFDDDKYFYLCLEQKRCAVCGKKNADLHHWDALGRGIDRKTYDDSGHRKISLCREHHSECHQIGRDTFAVKYYVRGVIYNK